MGLRAVMGVVVISAVAGCSPAAPPPATAQQTATAQQAAPASPVAGPDRAKHHFVKSRAGKTYPRDLVTTEAKLTAVMTDGRYSFLDEIWNPGFVVEPHFHTEHSETFYIVSGQVEWTVGGETHVMTTGDLVHIPPDTVHSVKVVGNQDLHTLMIYEPGGYEDHMDEEATYTPEQRAQQEIVDRMRKNYDYNPASAAVVAGARRTSLTAAATGEDATGFVARPAPAPASGKHRFAFRGKGEIFEPTLEVSEVKLSAAHTDGRYSFLDEIWKPGMSVPPHFHTRHSETFYIVAGQVEWTVGGETHVLSAGDLVYIPPDTIHSVKVVGDQNVQSLMIYNPGGYEYNSRREAQYTPEQLEQPEISRKVRQQNDFNAVGQ